MGAIPKTNRSAKEETRSSLHYGGEGVFVHSSYQGVCGWHGAEDTCVTSGELVGSRVAPGKPSLKRERKGWRGHTSSRTAEQYLKRSESCVTAQTAVQVGWGRRLVKGLERDRKREEEGWR